MNEKKIFTLDPINYSVEKLKRLIKSLHDKGQKYIQILDPGIKIKANYSTLLNGLKDHIFVKNETNTGYFIGEVWPGYCFYPDWFHPNSTKWWSHEISAYTEDIQLDGIVKTFTKIFQGFGST